MDAVEPRKPEVAPTKNTSIKIGSILHGASHRPDRALWETPVTMDALSMAVSTLLIQLQLSYMT